MKVHVLKRPFRRFLSAKSSSESSEKPANLNKVHIQTFSLFSPRTSDQGCSESYRDGLVRYEFEITVSSGTAFSLVPSKPKGSWSRRFDACVECGTKTRPHASRGLCSRCFARNYARGRRGSDAATIKDGSVKTRSSN